jgi:hypothetical protein
MLNTRTFRRKFLRGYIFSRLPSDQTYLMKYASGAAERIPPRAKARLDQRHGLSNLSDAGQAPEGWRDMCFQFLQARRGAPRNEQRMLNT